MLIGGIELVHSGKVLIFEQLNIRHNCNENVMNSVINGS